MNNEDKVVDLEAIRQKIMAAASHKVDPQNILTALSKTDPERLRSVFVDRDEVTNLLRVFIDLLTQHRYVTRDNWLVAALQAHRALIENWPRT